MKKGIKKLSAIFTLAAMPFLPTAPTSAFNPDTYDPVGVWKTTDGSQIIADVTRCNDDRSELCTTLYRTSNEPIDQVVERERSRLDTGLKPQPVFATKDYCEYFKDTRVSNDGDNVWESDSISLYAIFNAKARIELYDADRAKGSIKIRGFGFFPIATAHTYAEKISADSDEFKPCVTLKQNTGKSFNTPSSPI